MTWVLYNMIVLGLEAVVAVAGLVLSPVLGVWLRRHPAAPAKLLRQVRVMVVCLAVMGACSAFYVVSRLAVV